MRYQIKYTAANSPIIFDTENNVVFNIDSIKTLNLVCRLLNENDNQMKNILDVEFEDINNSLKELTIEKNN